MILVYYQDVSMYLWGYSTGVRDIPAIYLRDVSIFLSCPYALLRYLIVFVDVLLL